MFPQIPDMAFYVLALWARHPSHMTDIPCDPSPTFHRSFGHRDIIMHEFRVHGIPDIPIPDFLMGS